MTDCKRAELVRCAALRRFQDDDSASDVAGFWWQIFQRERKRRPEQSASRIAFYRAVSLVKRGRIFGNDRPKCDPALGTQVTVGFDAEGNPIDRYLPGFVDCIAPHDAHYRQLADLRDGGPSRALWKVNGRPTSESL